jgi:N-acetylmuramic acid 6-phosphate (MurNAc-6-P) etherase
MFPLDPANGKILRHARRYFGAYLPLCFNIISNIMIIKGRLYANHMSGVKASLYDSTDTRVSLCMHAPRIRRSKSVGGAEVSGVKASLYDSTDTRVSLCAANSQL